jgi:hypothetical protein
MHGSQENPVSPCRVRSYSNPKSFVNFLLPPRGFGEGWGGVKNLRLLQGLLYMTKLREEPGFLRSGLIWQNDRLKSYYAPNILIFVKGDI